MWDSPARLELWRSLGKQVWGDPVANNLSFRAPGSVHVDTQGCQPRQPAEAPVAAPTPPPTT